MSKKTVSITGAGGFIGSSLLEFLSHSSAVGGIYAHFRDEKQVPKTLPDTVRPIVGELGEPRVAEQLASADWILHFASRGFPSQSVQAPALDWLANLKATGVLLEAMRNHPSARILFAGTGGVLYRPTDSKVPFTEKSEVCLRSAYALTKFTVENLLDLYHAQFGIENVNLRISTVFGPGQYGRTQQGLIGVAMERLLNDHPLELWASPKTVKDFLYIDDLARAIEKILTGEIPSGTYNLGSGVGTPLSEVFQVLESLAHRKLKLHQAPMKNTDINWSILNCEKLKSVIEWEPMFSLEEACEKMWMEVKPRYKKSA